MVIEGQGRGVITHHYSYYAFQHILLINTFITQNLLQSSQDHPRANELTCQRQQPLPDSGSGPLLNISLQSLRVFTHITHNLSLIHI